LKVAVFGGEVLLLPPLAMNHETGLLQIRSSPEWAAEDTLLSHSIWIYQTYRKL
jgi:hypothetical protein